MEKKLKAFAIDILCDIIGSVAFGIGIVCFAEKAQFAPGGVSGVALMLRHLFGTPTGTVMFIINIPLLLLAFRYIGKEFTLRTLKSVLINTIIIDGIVTPFFPFYTGDRMIAAIFGGVCVGAGLAVIFYRGSTTGGTDIVGFLIEKKFPYIPIGKALLIIDCFVLLASVFVYHDVESALYGLIFIFFSSKVIDGIIYGLDKGKMVMIMSKKNELIADRIIRELDRSATLLESQGAYERKDSYVLLCVVRTYEYHKLQQLVHEEDPTAFMVVQEATQVLGEGFKEVSAK